MDRLKEVFGDSAIVAEDVRKTAYELEDKHNIASYPLLEAADHIESLYAEAVKMQAEIDTLKSERDALLAALQVIVDAGGIGSEDMFDDAREAIAKARGESV